MAKKDYYGTLGVEKNANADAIKKAFFKLAAKHHPDKGGDEAKFKEVNEAYQTLSDEKKRREYDMYGESFAGANNGGGSGFSGGFGGFDPSQFQDMGFDFGDMGDAFGDIFSGFGFGGPRERRGNDVSIEIEIPFAESIFGTERTVLVNKISACTTCKSTGADKSAGTTTCTTCNGKGKVNEIRKTFMGTVQSVRNCTVCDGTGQIPKAKCADCKGHGVKHNREEIHIVVPVGITNGEMIKMMGQGEGIKNGASGDMFVKVRVASHPIWSRNGSDLVMTHKIKLTDALLGTKQKILGLDGDMDIDIPAGVSIGETIRVSGRGVPSNMRKSRGDALIKLQIELPKKLSKSAKKLVEEMREEGL
jgi:molecular chaperone DnaJ